MKHSGKHHGPSAEGLHSEEHERSGDRHHGHHGRVESHGHHRRAESPQLVCAIENLKSTLKLRTENEALTGEQMRTIAEALDEAARKIESTSNIESGNGIESKNSATLQKAASPQMTSANGICCHDCRICREPVCIKTGKAKRGRSL